MLPDGRAEKVFEDGAAGNTASYRIAIIRRALVETRNDTLEEAAKEVEDAYADTGIAIAGRIRALKDEP